MFRNGPMPVLDRIKQVFQTEFGDDFSKLPNRHTTLFVMVQHGFATIRSMMDVVLEMGIPSNHVFMTTKPHTTSPEMLAYFQDTFKTQYVPFQWSSSKVTPAAQSRYKHLTAETHRQLFEKFCDYLLRYPKPAHIQNIIICDEGGKFLNEFINRYHNPDSRYSKKLSDYHVVAIEHTKCGTYSEALARLPFPLINMADSYLKTRIESEFIAKSMFVNLNAVLTRIITVSSVTIGLVGGGNIGREVLDFLLLAYPSASIIIYDHEPSVLSQAKIAENRWHNVSRVDSIQSLFQQAGIILGCTGKDITATLSLDCFAENYANQIHLISCSSGDVEFHTLLQRMPNYRFESLADVRDWTMPLDAEGNKQLIIYNGGFPMNFLVEQPAGIPAPESVPLQEVQITRSMKLAALVQALKLLEVTSFTPNENSLAGYMQLDALYQWEIIQALYHDLMNSPLPEKRIEAERKYARITKQEITQGSVGAPQPSMSSVLRIPNYITTHYQVRMQEQLLRQDTPIKLIIIHGTTGSGKTTLAQHALQKQRIQTPKHLNRVLLAETKAQWRASLRELTEELVPELNTLLQAEKDSQRQERLVDQHLQKALRKQKWCVVIDNWDQNALHIGEIERLFLNQESNVGNGTLIITTQGQSPYGEINSLDLSHGFAPEESRGLLIRVMNLEEEMSLSWQALGNDVELQALTTFLNHLPLATVLAGSYLMWENKSRRREGQRLFTYVDYRQMLELHVAKLVRAHDEQLGNRGRIPREDRAEFIRVKTQEAAVDLSLRKVIQISSREPNMNLWQLLCFCGFLASDGMPQQLLKDYVAQILSSEEAEVQTVVFDTLLEEAQKYSLLQFESKLSVVDQLQSLHMHRVIQKVLRDNFWQKLLSKVTEGGLVFSGRMLVAQVMMNAFEVRFRPMLQEKEYRMVREYRLHVETWISHKKDFAANPYFVTMLENELAQSYAVLGDFFQAEILYRQVLADTIRNLGADRNLDVAAIEQSLAGVLTHLGRYEEAVQLCRKALATSIICFGTENHINVANIQQNLANALKSLGRYPEAEELYRKALRAKQGHYRTENNVEVAGAQQSLAGMLDNLGRYDEAETAYRTALATLIRFRGENHIDVAVVQHNLGNILRIRGNYHDAIALNQKAITTKIAHYQTDQHMDVASTQQNQASIFSLLGRYDEVVRLYQKILVIMIRHYKSENHIEVAGIQQNLVNALRHLGRYGEAEVLGRKVLNAMTAHYNDVNHIHVAGAQQTLASVLQKLGKYQEAADLSRRAPATSSRHYGNENNINVAMVQQNLALSLQDLGLVAEAESLYRKALRTKIAHYNTETHLDVAITQHNLIGILCDSHRYSEAEPLASSAFATLKAHYGTDENVNVAMAQQTFASVLEGLERYEEAERLSRKTLATMIRHFGIENHPEVAGTQLNLAGTLAKRGLYDEAENLCRKALLTMTNNFGRFHPETTRVQRNLQIILDLRRGGYMPPPRTSSAYMPPQDFEPGKAIRQAAGEGRREQLGELLTRHPDFLNAIDSNQNRGWTALHWAIYNTKPDCVNELFQRGARYDIADKSTATKTAIDICIEKNNPHICQMLKKYIIKKYVRANDHDAERALRGAAANNDLAAAKFLITQGVNIDAVGPESGKTALHQAVQKKHLTMIELLINANADTHIEDFSGKKAINYAENDSALMSLFNETPNPNLMRHK